MNRKTPECDRCDKPATQKCGTSYGYVTILCDKHAEAFARNAAKHGLKVA